MYNRGELRLLFFWKDGLWLVRSDRGGIQVGSIFCVHPDLASLLELPYTPSRDQADVTPRP
jgi:hypothetical protein